MEDSVGKILVAATGKGGAGKSTTVACLAVYWHQAGKRVALVDSDPNQTLTRWHAKRSALSEIALRTQLDEHAIIPTIAEMASDHDVVLVDCAGFGNQAMVFAIGAADLVLIPVMTDEANVFEALRTWKIVESASLLTRRKIPAQTLLCRVKRSGIAAHARAQLVTLKAPPLEAQLNDRVLFQEATFHGSSPTALAPTSEAARDIAAVATEVEGLLWPRPAVVRETVHQQQELHEP
ncbi:MAG TPA: ParA family protein [Stellaceae bacterium]|jgi:chromosome partitioning protein|nr:ParA family protein [Stellaceae bacterium]